MSKGAAARAERWESEGACRVLLAVRHGWSKNPAAGAEVVSSGQAGAFVLYRY